MSFDLIISSSRAISTSRAGQHYPGIIVNRRPKESTPVGAMTLDRGGSSPTRVCLAISFSNPQRRNQQLIGDAVVLGYS
jgi:hypothetical protein